MKCIIVGVKPRDYVNKDGKQIKGFDLTMLADNAETFGKVAKSEFISVESPVYKANFATFDDMDALMYREVNVEFDVEMFGTKAVKRLVGFEFCDKFYDLVERKAK